ncbi:MAG: 3'-5' exonuclease domain-containing protein 2 [Thiobacillaceae bacterium]|nr:3'-5' exonuclease domain-containing protein 2 [Thiobacillaceae bacterium]
MKRFFIDFFRTLHPASGPLPPLRARLGAIVSKLRGRLLPSDHGALPAELPRMISREELANLPIRRYEGEVCIVATPEDLESAMADIRRERVVGFDTETRPAFRKGESHLPCLVQVATARAVYLFQLQRLDCAAALGELLAAPRIVKAGVALAHDLRQLGQLFPISVAAVHDLGSIARRHGLRQSGLRNLAGLFLSFRIAKGTRTSNWAAPRLTAAQISYAATDAWVCRELYLRFHALGLMTGGAG